MAEPATQRPTFLQSLQEWTNRNLNQYNRATDQLPMRFDAYGRQEPVAELSPRDQQAMQAAQSGGMVVYGNKFFTGRAKQYSDRLRQAMDFSPEKQARDLKAYKANLEAAAKDVQEGREFASPSEPPLYHPGYSTPSRQLPPRRSPEKLLTETEKDLSQRGGRKAAREAGDVYTFDLKSAEPVFEHTPYNMYGNDPQWQTRIYVQTPIRRELIGEVGHSGYDPQQGIHNMRWAERAPNIAVSPSEFQYLRGKLYEDLRLQGMGPGFSYYNALFGTPGRSPLKSLLGYGQIPGGSARKP